MKIIAILGVALLLHGCGKSDNCCVKNSSEKCSDSCGCGGCAYCPEGKLCAICSAKKGDEPVIQSTGPSSQSTKSSISSQCQAITKKGARCRRSARANSYCWQHGK